MIDFSSPNTVAFLQFLGLGFLGIVAAFGQWFGKRKESAPPASKDVVIPSLAIADSHAITEWAKTLQESNRLIRNREEFERKMLFEAETTSALLNDIKHILARTKRPEAID